MTNLFLACLLYSCKGVIALTLILKGPYFWFQKVGILSWLANNNNNNSNNNDNNNKNNDENNNKKQ